MAEVRDDAALLAAHVAGDPDAFAELVARHRDRLWAVALRTTGHPEDAADGLQDGLVAAYRRAGSFRGEAAVTTWLHRVVVNACLDRLRAARSRRTEPLPDDLEEYGSRRGVVDDGEQADPVEASIAAERRGLVLAALQALPVAQRAALVLVDLEGFSIAEAAAVLECKEGTVKSRCSRGRSALAEALRPLLAEPGPRARDATPAAGGVSRPGNQQADRGVSPVPPTRDPPGDPPVG